MFQPWPIALDPVRRDIIARHQESVGIAPDGLVGEQSIRWLSECHTCGCYVLSKNHTDEECLIGEIAKFMEE